MTRQGASGALHPATHGAARNLAHSVQKTNSACAQRYIRVWLPENFVGAHSVRPFNIKYTVGIPCCRGRCPHRPVRYDIRMCICSGSVQTAYSAFARWHMIVWLPGGIFRFIHGILRYWLRGHRATLPLVTSLTLYKRHDLLSLDGTYGVWLPGDFFRFVHGILRNYLRRYSACRGRCPHRPVADRNMI